MNSTSGTTANVESIAITSAAAAIQSLLVDILSSSHFATPLPEPKRLKKPFKSEAVTVLSTHGFQHSVE